MGSGKDMSKSGDSPDSIIGVEVDPVGRVAILRIPDDLTARSETDIEAFMNALVAARAKWEAQGYVIRYRSAGKGA